MSEIIRLVATLVAIPGGRSCGRPHWDARGRPR